MLLDINFSTSYRYLVLHDFRYAANIGSKCKKKIKRSQALVDLELELPAITLV